MSVLTRDGTAEHSSRAQILRRGREQGKNTLFSLLTDDYEQKWHPFPVDNLLSYVMTTHRCISYWMD